MQQRLTRSRSERVIWGVCGGLGNYFGVDPVIVRLIFIVLALTTGIGFLAYPILALAMPLDKTSRPAAFPTPAPSVAQPSLGQTINLRVDEATEAQFVPPQPHAAVPQRQRRWRIVGVAMLGLGVLFLAESLGLRADIIWPALIIVLGAWLLRRRV